MISDVGDVMGNSTQIVHHVEKMKVLKRFPQEYVDANLVILSAMTQLFKIISAEVIFNIFIFKLHFNMQLLLECHDDCGTCRAATEFDCLDCKNDAMLYDPFTFSCYCPSKTFKQDSTCIGI